MAKRRMATPMRMASRLAQCPRQLFHRADFGDLIHAEAHAILRLERRDDPQMGQRIPARNLVPVEAQADPGRIDFDAVADKVQPVVHVPSHYSVSSMIQSQSLNATSARQSA